MLLDFDMLGIKGGDGAVDHDRGAIDQHTDGNNLAIDMDALLGRDEQIPARSAFFKCTLPDKHPQRSTIHANG